MGVEMGNFSVVSGGKVVVIRRSHPGDIFTILDLLALARATMRRRGNDVQWPVGIPRPVDVERDIMLAPMPPYIGWHRMGGIGGSGGYVWIFAQHATRR